MRKYINKFIIIKNKAFNINELKFVKFVIINRAVKITPKTDPRVLIKKT